jgi:hypothetical protein
VGNARILEHFFPAAVFDATHDAAGAYGEKRRPAIMRIMRAIWAKAPWPCAHTRPIFSSGVFRRKLMRHQKLRSKNRLSDYAHYARQASKTCFTTELSRNVTRRFHDEAQPNRQL